MTIKWTDQENIFRFQDDTIHAAYGITGGSFWWTVTASEDVNVHEYGVEESLAVAKQNAEDTIVKLQKERDKNAT